MPGQGGHETVRTSIEWVPSGVTFGGLDCVMPRCDSWCVASGAMWLATSNSGYLLKYEVGEDDEHCSEKHWYNIEYGEFFSTPLYTGWRCLEASLH